MTTSDPKWVSTIRRGRLAAVTGTVTAATLISACGTPEPNSTSVSDPSPTATTSATGHPSTPVASPSSPPSSSSSSPDPTKGWHTVRYTGLQYKVPPEWKIETVRTGDLKVPRPTYGKGFCKASPNESLGMVLLTRNTDFSSPKKAVRAELQHAAEAFYGDRSPQLDLGQQKHTDQVAVGAAGIELAPSDDPCDGSSALVVVRGWTAPDASGVDLLVAIGELGHDQSPDAGDIARIANSVRSAD